MALLDVTLSGLSLSGKDLTTVGTGPGQDIPWWWLGGVLSLSLSVGLRVLGEESSPLSLTSRARQLVGKQLAAQENLVQVVLRPRVELGEVAPDGLHGDAQLVGEPEPWTAQSLVRWLGGTELANHVDLAPHLPSSLLPVVGEVSHGDLLIVDLAVVLHQLLAEKSLTSGLVTPGLALSAGHQDVVVGLHVVLQLGHLLEALLTGWALQDPGWRSQTGLD